MITTPEQEENRLAQTLLRSRHVETGDDPRSYSEIAKSLGLLPTTLTSQLVLSEEQTTL